MSLCCLCGPVELRDQILLTISLCAGTVPRNARWFGIHRGLGRSSRLTMASLAWERDCSHRHAPSAMEWGHELDPRAWRECHIWIEVGLLLVFPPSMNFLPTNSPPLLSDQWIGLNRFTVVDGGPRNRDAMLRSQGVPSVYGVPGYVISTEMQSVRLFVTVPAGKFWKDKKKGAL